MKGLLKKDLLMIVKYCRFLVLMCLIFAVVSGFSTELLFPGLSGAAGQHHAHHAHEL